MVVVTLAFARAEPIHQRGRNTRIAAYHVSCLRSHRPRAGGDASSGLRKNFDNAAYANAFVFMSLAMVLTRTAVLLVKMRKLNDGNTTGGRQAEPVTNGASV